MILILLIALALAVTGRILGGRIAGAVIVVVLGCTMAYFFMTPVFSFEVARMYDRVLLAFYGLTGLVLAGSPRPKRDFKEPTEEGAPVRPERAETMLSSVVETILAGGPGDQLRAFGLKVFEPGDSRLPVPAAEALRIVSDVLEMASGVPQLQQLTIYSARASGWCRVVIGAHRTWPPPLNEVVVGWSATNCVSEHPAEWPPAVEMKWFDNGYERLYEIAFAPSEPRFTASSV